MTGKTSCSTRSLARRANIAATFRNVALSDQVTEQNQRCILEVSRQLGIRFLFITPVRQSAVAIRANLFNLIVNHIYVPRKSRQSSATRRD
jgi:hypothetical protein